MALIVETGRVGWGYAREKLRSLSLGLIRFSWCPGFLAVWLKTEADRGRGK